MNVQVITHSPIKDVASEILHLPSSAQKSLSNISHTAPVL